MTARSPDIKHFPFDDTEALDKWAKALEGPMSRLVANEHALKSLGYERLAQAIRSRQWSLSETDKKENALLCALSMVRFYSQDLATSAKQDLTPIMPKEQQGLLRALFEHGCNPMHCAPGGADCIDLALVHNAPELLKAWLSWIDPTTRLVMGLPYPHIASGYTRLGSLKVLLDCGMDVNMTDDRGNTPLFYASHSSTVEFLCKHGANRSHLNHEGLDARSVWQSQRGIKTDQLSSMIGALGKLPPPAAPQSALTQFLSLIKTAPPSQLHKERLRLGVDGSQTLGDRSIVSETIERGVPLLAKTNDLSRRTTFKNWVEQLLAWEEAWRPASHQQVAKLAAIATSFGMTDIAPLLEAKLPPKQAPALLLEAIEDTFPQITSTSRSDARNLHARLSARLMSLDLPGPTRAQSLLRAFSQYGSPDGQIEEVFREAARMVETLSGTDPAWKVPGFVTLLMQLGTGPVSVNAMGPTSEEVEQDRLRQALLDLCLENYVFNTQALRERMEETANFLGAAEKRKDFFEQALILHDRFVLTDAAPCLAARSKPRL